MGKISLFPYYGAKNRMANLIAGMLDYCNSTIYVEGFAGALNVLLNSGNHEYEECFEANPGMFCVLKLLSDEDTAMDFINRLYDTDFTEDCFYEHLAIRKRYEESPVRSLIKSIESQLCFLDVDGTRKSKNIFQKDLRTQVQSIFEKNGFDDLVCRDEGLAEDFLRLNNYLDIADNDIKYSMSDGLKESELAVAREADRWRMRYYEKNVKRTGISYDQFKTDFKSKFLKRLMKKIKDNYMSEFYTLCDTYDKEHTEPDYQICYESMMELAVSTYVVQVLSRDGMGKEYSKSLRHGRYKANETYLNRISGLYDVMKRMQGVNVYNSNFLTLIKGIKRFNSKTEGSDIERIEQYLYNKNACLYLDPPYYKDVTTIDDGGSLVEANPGAVYQSGWTRADHEVFLEVIRDAKCKIIVSNYTDKYHTYDCALTTDGKWQRLEYPTKTSISKTDNNRVECLWYKGFN